LALEQAMTSGIAVHVVEDDVILSGYVPQVLETIATNGSLDLFDIVFTEMLIGPDVMDIREHKRLFDKLRTDETFMVRDITSSYWGGMTSYAVGPKNISRVVAALKKGLGSDPPVAIDLFIKRTAAAGNLKLGCVFPFVTTIPLENATTIGDRASSAQLSRYAFNLLRYSFFVDRDPECFGPAIAALRVSPDSHREVVEAVLGFVISDRFALF
jgi:GR25 family glycosyltransferase involved in LPS biosynthesis